VAEAVQKIKANSSHWLGERGIQFEWQKGYGVFSVSPSMLPTVTSYIEHQQGAPPQTNVRGRVPRAVAEIWRFN
jgi:Transposase IS200 like